MTDIMLDLETMGTKAGSAIASIGAVVFDPIKGDLGAEIYVAIDLASCQQLGLTMDAGTVGWWLTQSAEARAALLQSPVSIRHGLEAFAHFYNRERGHRLWSHGANFDEPVLGAAYQAAGIRTPWRYSASRCTRTVFDMAGVAVSRDEGTHHNALDDAKAQARAVNEAWLKLGLTKVA